MAVLAIQPGALGDLVVSLPALRWLRQGPGAGGMEIWAERANLPLVSHPAYSDHARPLAETGFDSYPLPARTLDALATFDLVVSWRGAAVPELAAAVSAVQPEALFLPQFPPREAALHLADFRCAQVRELFGGQAGAIPEVFLDDADHEFARDYLAADAGHAPLVAIHPGASSARKHWPAGDFARVASELAGRWGACILMVEGPLDSAAVEAVMCAAAALGARRVAIENLRRLAAVLACCHLFIGNDSGVTHLAAAAGAPVVAVFVATDPRLWAPRGRHVAVLERPSAHEVVAAADTMLESLSKGRNQCPTTPRFET